MANFEIMSSPEWDDDKLKNLLDVTKNRATSSSTHWGIKRFTEWLEKRGKTCDFKTVTAEDLNTLLRKFYAEVKPSTKSKVNSLSPPTMTCLRAAIRRYIIEDMQRNLDIINDKDFLTANQMFKAKCKLYVATHNPKPKHKPVIEAGDMKKLGAYFDSYRTNPDILMEALWFYICYFFGRRGREGWTEMNKSSFNIKTDSEGQKYVHMGVTEATKNHQGGHKPGDIDYSDQRMYGPGVEIMEFCLTKLNPECNRLFQYPMSNYAMDGIWFKNMPLGKNKLGVMMNTISKKAGLTQTYTCHSVRASTITHLYRAGIQASSIINVTNHKNTSSLSHYIEGLSEKEKRQCSNILSDSMKPHTITSHSNQDNSKVNNIINDNIIIYFPIKLT